MSPQQRQLILQVLNLRETRYTYLSLERPQSVGFDTVTTPAGPQQRCRVSLTAHGCRVASCTMCPLPDEAVALTTEVTTEHWLAQLRWVFQAPCRPVDILTLFHNGNFFSDREVPVSRREAVYAWLRATSVTTLVVESLPQFVTKEKLAHAAVHLGATCKLEVAIGLQSVDAYLRQTVLASTCTSTGFVLALTALRAQGFSAQVFLMHQMPFLTPEESSVALVHSVRVLKQDHAVDGPILCPLRIAQATVAGDLHRRGQLQLASLWHLLDVLVQIRKVVPGSRARVAISLLQPSTELEPHTDCCPLCRPAVLAWISAFNCQKEGPPPARCSCAATPVNFNHDYAPTEVAARIDGYLAEVQKSAGTKPLEPATCKTSPCPPARL